jgi:predicted transcriptional regulator
VRIARGIFIALGVGALATPTGAPAGQSQGAKVMASKLSFASSSIVMTLGVSHPQKASELSNNSAVYGDSFKESIRDLRERGLITQLANDRYDLSPSGVMYVEKHYEIIRHGDRTTVNTRNP